jgi:hypothetical protein
MVIFLLFSPFWLYINVVCLAICEGWDFTCMWKALACIFLGSFHKSGDKMKNKKYLTFGTRPNPIEQS